jgi:hypothetical protein
VLLNVTAINHLIGVAFTGGVSGQNHRRCAVDERLLQQFSHEGLWCGCGAKKENES